MIIDLKRFLSEERKHWEQLEQMLDQMEMHPERRLSLEEIGKFHELYQRSSADLIELLTVSSEPEIRGYLEGLVARAYGEIHETRESTTRAKPWQWFFQR